MRTDLHCEEYYVSPYRLASMEAANGYRYLTRHNTDYHYHQPSARPRRRRPPSLPPAAPPPLIPIDDDYYVYEPPVRYHRGRGRRPSPSRPSEVSIPTTVYHQEQRPRSFIDEQPSSPPSLPRHHRARRLSAPLEYETMIPRKPVPSIDALTGRLQAISISPPPDIPRPSRPLQLKSPLSVSSSSTSSAGSNSIFEPAALQPCYSSPVSDISTTAPSSSRHSSNKKQPRQTRRASSMPERKNKFNRVHSALPSMYKPGGEKEQIEEEQYDDELEEDQEQEKLINLPTFWNPRLEQNVAPMRRTLSRRLRGLLLPQRIRIDGGSGSAAAITASASQHAADRVWSVERANTPLQTRSASSSSSSSPDKPNPFQILKHTMPVADSSELEFTEPDFEQIDAYAANVKQRGPMLTTQVLAQKFLARPYKRDLYKIRSIFVWIMQNICLSSDSNNLMKIRKAMMMRRQQQQQADQVQREETAESVLSSRSCQTPLGLARLFCEMASFAGIQEATIVYGYLRGLKDSLEATILPNGSLAENHVWCSVKVEGEYRLVDCWLASPYHPANKDVMEPHWFLCRPTDMIYTHMPSNDHHQYLCPPVSINTFFALPFVTTEFFAHRIRVLNFDPSVCDLKDDQVCHITLQLDRRDVSCYAEVETRSQSSANHTQVVKTRALAQCTTDRDGERICKIKAVLPPDQWLGWLKIYAGRKVAPCSSASTTTAHAHAVAAQVAAAAHAHNQQKLVEAQNYPLAMCFRLTHQPGLTSAAGGATRSPPRPFDFVQLHAVAGSDEFYIQEPQCYQLYPLHSYNFCVKSEQTHHKLAIKSPNGKLYKLMYYPQDHTYNGNLIISEQGTWSLICLLNHAGGWYVVATWICKS